MPAGKTASHSVYCDTKLLRIHKLTMQSHARLFSQRSYRQINTFFLTPSPKLRRNTRLQYRFFDYNHSMQCQAQTTSSQSPNNAVLASVLGILIAVNFTTTQPILQEEIDTKSHSEIAMPGEHEANLKTYSLEDLRTSDIVRDRIWVTYNSGIYDITDFLSSHPGGGKILLAQGRSITPFWQLYATHHQQEVYTILESLRIGNLHPDDVVRLEESCTDRCKGPYDRDPDRHPALCVNSQEPFNAEPPSDLLNASHITPNALFFVRNHLPVPLVDENDYRLEISAPDLPSVELTMDDLRNKFRRHAITSTIQCAGNRRSELSKMKQVNGLNWGSNAISTAQWSGVLLSDVLKSLKPTKDLEKMIAKLEHVQFEGLDKDVEGKCYGASIPLSTAMDPNKDVLLAFEMNGAALPRDHGFPLRVIVPGTVGARNVKFLHRIILSPEESPSFWQRKDYRGYPPNIDYSTPAYWQFAGPSIQELPVQSAFCEPQEKKIKNTEPNKPYPLTLKGYAWSGGGRNIIRVDVSIDGGKNWTPAQLDQEGQRQPYNRAWAWTLWEVTVPIPVGMHHVEAVCRAVDSSYNTQPEAVEHVWNLRGLLNNSWHRLQITIETDQPQNS